MRKYILILGFVLSAFDMNGQFYKTIQVTTPGTLGNLLTSEEKTVLTHLTVTGTVDSTDFITMRDNMPEVRFLDLSGASTVNNALYQLALSYKNLLDTVFLPHSITRIGQEALMYCSIKSLIIPPSVTLIEHAAFRYCPLQYITIPASVRNIESTVFSACDSLRAIYVDEENTEFCSLDGVLFNKDATVLITCPPKKLGTYIIPSTVTEIASGGFAGCHWIQSIFIPASVSKIGDIGFYGCSSLIGFQVEETSEFYSDIDGVLFSRDLSVLIQYPLNKPDNSYVVPHGTTILASNSFNGCRILQAVTLPVTLTVIEESVFRYCNGLTTIELPPSVKTIGWYTFGSCNYLQRIRIPSSLDNIGKCILCGANELDTIILNSAIPLELSPVNSYFDGVDTNTCVLMVPSGSTDAYRSSLHWKSFVNISEYDTRFEVSQTEFNIEAAGGKTAFFTITSNNEWRIKSNEQWLQFSDTIGINNKTVTITADPNTGSGERQAIADLMPLEKEKIDLYITQSGIATQVDPPADKKNRIYYDATQKYIVVTGILNHTLSVYTVDGRLIMSHLIKEEGQMISVENLPAGIYIVKSSAEILKIAVRN
jgi:hypothetical protein